MPEFVVARIGTRTQRDALKVQTRTTYAIEDDQPHNLDRARQIAQRAEPAVTGCWHDYGFRLGCEMARCAVSPEMAVVIAMEDWASRGQGLTSEAQMERDVLGGYQQAMRDGEHGVDSREAYLLAFKGLHPPVDDPAPALPTTTTDADAPAGPAWRRICPTSLAGGASPAA